MADDDGVVIGKLHILKKCLIGSEWRFFFLILGGFLFFFFILRLRAMKRVFFWGGFLNFYTLSESCILRE